VVVEVVVWLDVEEGLGVAVEVAVAVVVVVGLGAVSDAALAVRDEAVEEVPAPGDGERESA
jgi:hypothetical protein